MLISQLEVCQEGVSRRVVLGGHRGFLTGDMDERVIPQGRFPENCVLISQLEVCQEGGYLEDVESS